MAYSEVVSSVKATLKLDNGTSPSGTVRTVNVGMGTMDTVAWTSEDLQKYGAIVEAMVPVMGSTIREALHTVEYTVTDND